MQLDPSNRTVYHPPLKLNPFSPNDPATKDSFVGRKNELDIITNSLYRTCNGKPEHILIKGERGIGKTSLAIISEHISIYLSEIAHDQNIRYFTVFNSLGATKSVEEVCIKILENCSNKIKESHNKVYKDIVEILKNIKGFTIGSIGIQFDFKENARNVITNFDNLIKGIWNNIKDKYSGMLIIIDETDNISNDINLASFFKSLIETLQRENFNKIMFLFTVTPSGLNNMLKGHEAFPRLFKSIEISNLTEDESNELVKNSLKLGEPILRASKKFLKFVFAFSDGVPCFIHEICYAAFEVCKGSTLTYSDFRNGVLGTKNVKGAKDSIYDKHFRQKYTQDILSNSYREILHIMSLYVGPAKASEIIKKFSGKKHTCRTYLSRLVDRGIIKREEGKLGYYNIPEEMFRLWLRFSDVTQEMLKEEIRTT